MSAARTTLPGKGGLLLLQPAFLGDVVLSTAVLESWQIKKQSPHMGTYLNA